MESKYSKGITGLFIGVINTEDKTTKVPPVPEVPYTEDLRF